MKQALVAAKGLYGQYTRSVLDHAVAVLEGRQAPLVYPHPAAR